MAYDTANLLRYAGVPREKIVVFETDDPAAITRLISVEASAQVYLLAWLHHFQRLREVMTHERR